jgi:hypothetical protein
MYAALHMASIVAALAQAAALGANVTELLTQNLTTHRSLLGGSACDQFICQNSPSKECVHWEKVADGTDDCPNKEDEQYIERVRYCPRLLKETGAVGYLTFATDLGRTYATRHKQDSIKTNSLIDITPLNTPDTLGLYPEYNPCVFPFEYDSDGDGVMETYTECTKVCTSKCTQPTCTLKAGQVGTCALNSLWTKCTDEAKCTFVPASGAACTEPSSNIKNINPKISMAASALLPVNQGCEEEPKTATEDTVDRQQSRLWCATEVDGAGRVKRAQHCTNDCKVQIFRHPPIPTDF